MGRPTDWHVLDLDRDPTPGDPTRVEQLARRLHDFAEDVGAALRSIRGLAGDSAVQSWTGLAGDEYRRQFDDVPGELEKLERSYRLCGDALASYWPKLQQAQGDADRALQQGREARADLSSAQSRLHSANAWVDRANAKSKEYQERGGKADVPPPDPDQVRAATRNASDAQSAQRSAQSSVDAAQGRLDAAKELAEQARGLRDDAARSAKGAIDDASDAGIQNKHWWEKAADWVVDHWDDIVAVCKVIVAVVGIIVLIIGGPLAWLVLAAALVVLADTIMKYLQGKASLWDVAFAALDCIPGMKGLTTAGGLLKMAKGGLKGMKGLSGHLGDLAKGLRGGLGALRRTAKSMGKRVCLTDPVDVASGEMVMPQTDVELPGVLPLVLGRAFISSYGSGRWFGSSWASTLDQRLEIDDEGVTFVADDGMILYYPMPAPGLPVMPVEGPRWPLIWDGAPGGVITVTDPDPGLTLHFDPSGPKLPRMPGGTGAMELPLRKLTDRNGNHIAFDHAPDGTLTQIRHSGGYRVGVETTDGRITALRLLNHERRPLLMRYAYDADGHLTEVVNSPSSPAFGKGAPDAPALRFTYDTRGRITSWHDRNGTRYGYTYDDDGRCVRTTGSDGYLCASFAYDPENRTTVVTDSLGHERTFQMNEALQVVREVDPLGHATISAWDRYDRLLSRTDPLGRTTHYAYDADGNLIGITRPDGSTATAEFDDHRLPTEITQPDGTRWRHEYDDRGNRLRTTDPTGATTHYAYDDRGHLSEVTDALGRVCRVACDAAGLPVTLTDPLGATTRYTRDAFGRFTEITDPLGGTTRFGWTTEGRMAWRTMPDGSTEKWIYDGEGNVVEHQDLAEHTTRFEITHFDLPSARIAADGTRLEFTYDTELRLVSVTNPRGLTWSYEYDPAGNLIRETDFDGRILSYRYDPAGQLIERTNGAAETIRYTRDLLGNVIEQRSGQAVTTFERDRMGRLVRAVSPHAQLVHARDPLGRVTAETCNGRTLTNRFDPLGRRVERRTPSGAVSTWAYDATGLPVSLETDAGSLLFAHDPAGREIERRFGDAVLTQDWDANHQMTAQRLTGAATTARQRTFRYRADGYLTAIEETGGQGSGSRRFDLDATGRVTSVRAAGWTETYAYDAAGNVTHAAAPGDAAADTRGERAYQGMLLRRAGRTHYEWDGQGRIVRQVRKLLSGGRRTWTYSWDAEDRLAGAVGPDGSLWRYRYDPLGRRIAKERLAEDGTVAERVDFVWDDTCLAEQIRDGRTITWDWAPGSHRAVAQTEGPAPCPAHPEELDQAEVDRRFHTIVTNLTGAPTELVDSEGRVGWQSRTDLWGLALGEAPGDLDCPLGLPGQYRDPETGLHYNNFRHYDPHTARYVSPDPLGLDPAPNHYAYVPNPLRWSDPLGLAPCTNFWTKADYHGQRIYQRDDLVNPSLIHPADKYGRSNLKRMQQGLAPLGPDGKPMNLHHMLQTQDGPIAEITASMHSDFSHILHWKSGTKIPSGIDREAFDTWRTQYWKDRAAGFTGG